MSDVAYPTEWKSFQLREIAEIQTGLAKGKKTFKDPLELPYLRVANVQAGHLDLSEVKTVTVERADVERYGLKDGDVLLTEGGDFDKLGRGTLWRGEIGCCLHQNHVFVVRTNRAVLLPEYLVWLTNSPIGRRYFVRASKQSTNLASINSTQLKQYPVVIPPVDEQKAIARVIRTWEAGIGQAERLLRSKRRLKRVLMQQLLTGKRRFAEFVQSGAVRSTPLGRLPRDWSIAHIGELFRQVRRKNEVGVDHVLTASGRHGLVDQREYFNRSVAGKSLTGYYLLRRGEFAYNRSTMKGYPYGAIKRLDRYDEGALSTLYLCFALAAENEESDSDFYAHFFQSGLLNRQLRDIVQVGARAHGLLNVPAGDFYDLVVPDPSHDEQRAIANVLSAAEREIHLLNEKLGALKEQKHGLMQKLLTGQVRVPTGATQVVAGAET
jgi:type I restriction enzyme, S subunit